MRAILVVLSLSILSACAGRYRAGAAVASAPSVSVREARTLSRVASRHMRCPEAAISTRPIADRLWQVSGCGQTREFVLRDRGWRREAWYPIPPATERASNELACPTDALVVHAPSDGVRNVSGCGQRATYQLACDVRACSWVMTERDGPAIAVQPPAYAPPPSGTVIVVPDRTDPVVDSAMRSALEARRAQVLACTGGRAVSVTATWSADGRVWAALGPPHHGTATERCVQDAVTGLRVVAPGATGSITHVVR